MDGIVKEWLSNYVQLKSTTDESTIIITDPTRDIMVIKILPEEKEESEPIVIPLDNPRSPAEVFRNPPKWEDEEKADYSTEKLREDFRARLYKEIPEEKELHDNLDLRTKKLAELKIMANKQEREVVASKLKTHHSAYVPHKPDYGSQIDLLPRGRRKD
jgi:hypothetical protein